jgi:hypothetical protein
LYGPAVGELAGPQGAEHRLELVADHVALGGGLVVVGELVDDGPAEALGGGAVGRVLGLDAVLVAVDVGGERV